MDAMSRSKYIRRRLSDESSTRSTHREQSKIQCGGLSTNMCPPLGALWNPAAVPLGAIISGHYVKTLPRSEIVKGTHCDFATRVTARVTAMPRGTQDGSPQPISQSHGRALGYGSCQPTLCDFVERVTIPDSSSLEISARRWSPPIKISPFAFCSQRDCTKSLLRFREGSLFIIRLFRGRTPNAISDRIASSVSGLVSQPCIPHSRPHSFRVILLRARSFTWTV
jgi:hypothetical protein